MVDDQGDEPQDGIDVLLQFINPVFSWSKTIKHESTQKSTNPKRYKALHKQVYLLFLSSSHEDETNMAATSSWTLRTLWGVFLCPRFLCCCCCKLHLPLRTHTHCFRVYPQESSSGPALIQISVSYRCFLTLEWIMWIRFLLEFQKLLSLCFFPKPSHSGLDWPVSPQAPEDAGKCHPAGAASSPSRPTKSDGDNLTGRTWSAGGWPGFDGQPAEAPPFSCRRSDWGGSGSIPFIQLREVH